jgi:hypothetical protein
VPLTFFAHQAPMIPLKRAWPHAFDGTALCVGAAAPDLAYPLGTWLSGQSHTAIGVAVWAVPATIVACTLIRLRLAASVFAQLPDAGSLRLHSWCVLGARWPAWWTTVTSALIGATSHVLIDGFTHRHRFGANLLHLNDVLFSLAGREFTSARVLQYLGHTLGSLVGLLLLVEIGRRRRLEQWYGVAAVAAARAFSLPAGARAAFWAVVAVGPPAGVAWASTTDDSVIFTVIVTTLVAIAVAGLVIPPRRPPVPRG